MSPRSPPFGPASPPPIGSEVVNLPIDYEWLARAEEETLEPALPIVDAHGHMGERSGARYLPPELLADIAASGHNVIANVYVEDCTAYRSTGSAAFRPVGETEIMAAIPGAWTDSRSTPRINLAIVGYADLSLGSSVRNVLEAHVEAGRGRFRGVRQATLWSDQPALMTRPRPLQRTPVAHMLADERFQAGFACLAPLGLSFDAWLYHPQLSELVDLARAFPETTIVVDHLGGLVRVGPYRGRRDEAYAEWTASMAALAHLPNVAIKIGGLGMQLFGFGFRERRTPPSSAELASLWRPYVEPCIEKFGPARSMFESNFPVDKAYFSYRTVWNAFKRLTGGATAVERRALFQGAAERAYQISSAEPDAQPVLAGPMG